MLVIHILTVRNTNKKVKGKVPIVNIPKTSYLLLLFSRKDPQTSWPYLAIAVSLPQASFLWVVEPLDPDHHAGAPGLPEALYSSHVGQLGPTW